MAEKAIPEYRRMIPVEGHPGIWRRGNRYVVKYSHRGKRCKKSLRTLTEAKRFKAAVAAGEAQPTSARAFNAYATEWVRTYTGRTAGGISDDTRASYAAALTGYAIPYFGTIRLDHIDAPKVRAFIAHLASDGVAPNSVRRYYAPVRALLATAYEDGLLRTNPAQGVRVIVRDRRPAKPKRLTTEQTRALLAAMPPEHADLAYFLAATGVRISEALRARWGDLGRDVDGRPTLTVHKSKTRAGERTIPLTPETLRMLTRRRAEATYAADDDPLFPTSSGTELDDHNYRRRVFNPARVAAGMPWATPHKLRHGVASLMAEQGYGAADIAALLGHADGGALALRVYVHPKVRSVDFLDAALSADGVPDGVPPVLNLPATR
jgi:integrase